MAHLLQRAPQCSAEAREPCSAAQVRQNKGRGWEEEAAALSAKERQLQSELASSGPASAAAPALGALGGSSMPRPLPDVETELRRVQR